MIICLDFIRIFEQMAPIFVAVLTLAKFRSRTCYFTSAVATAYGTDLPNYLLYGSYRFIDICWHIIRPVGAVFGEALGRRPSLGYTKVKK